MVEEVAAEGVVTNGAVEDAGVNGEPFSVGDEPTGGETGEAAGGSVEPELYVVKVGGKEERVSFEDLQNGYMRQADYTRKTQELASQRDQVAQMLALQTALERDPRTTLAALAGALGVDLGVAQSPAAAQLGADADPLELLAKQVETLSSTLTAQQQAALAAQQQQAQQAAVQAQIDREIAELRETHGEFDPQELARYAVEHQINAPLHVVYRAWQFDKSEQQKVADRNAAVLAKRNAQVVNGGRGTGGTGAVAPGNGGGRMTFREALSAAVAQHSQ